jgi:hypothetical protein
MKMNFKQKELVDFLFNSVKERFPEIEIENYSTSPDDPDHIWINVIAPMEEDREMELWDYSAELEADIHIDYGYRISIMPDNPNLVLS